MSTMRTHTKETETTDNGEIQPGVILVKLNESIYNASKWRYSIPHRYWYAVSICNLIKTFYCEGINSTDGAIHAQQQA